MNRTYNSNNTTTKLSAGNKAPYHGKLYQ